MMRSRSPYLLAVIALLVALLPLPSLAAERGASAAKSDNARNRTPMIARELSPEQRQQVPKQLTAEEAEEVVAATATTTAQCADVDGTVDLETLTLTLSGWDPDHPLTQDVVFVRETDTGNPGLATLWIAWDFLTTDYGREDVITCAQIEYLQSKMDAIVATDVEFFGEYIERPAGNPNIDVMIYNIVDEAYFDPDFGSYIAGFFSSGLSDEFDRNMIFIDSYDWGNRLGPNDSAWRPDDGPGNDRPFLYEGTVAHELEHLIHRDHDGDEESWIDEGLADLAQLVNGFGHDDGHVVYYLAFHRTSLTQWGSMLEDYGAAYLFQVYLAEQFAGLTQEYDGSGGGNVLNPAWTRALVAEEANSILGVETVASAFHGGPVSFVDMFDSWILANYLDEPGRPGDHGGWPLGYESIDLRPFVADGFSPWSIERSIKDIYGSGHKGNLPTSRYYGGYVSGTVEYPVGALPPHTPLYGTFKGAQPALDVYLRGAIESGVAPDDGDYEIASGSGHMLTDRWVELGTVNSTLDFRTWFNIEEDWDFGFVEFSTDGGATWTPLVGSITRTSTNPFGSTAWKNALGSATSTDAAITGSSYFFEGADADASDGWVDAHFDIPGPGLVRLNYWTDEAYNDEGWFVDSVAIDGGTPMSFETQAEFDALGDTTWLWTTGLFPNDWVAGYVNPVYYRGKFVDTEVGYFTGQEVGGNQYVMGTIDTSALNRDEATIVFANRPGESPFDANYVFLPGKGKAG